MKKFLSILLALAVGFTFTFGSAMSAFAATTAEPNDADKLTYDQAVSDVQEAAKNLRTAEADVMASALTDIFGTKANATLDSVKVNKADIEKLYKSEVYDKKVDVINQEEATKLQAIQTAMNMTAVPSGDTSAVTAAFPKYNAAKSAIKFAGFFVEGTDNAYTYDETLDTLYVYPAYSAVFTATANDKTVYTAIFNKAAATPESAAPTGTKVNKAGKTAFTAVKDAAVTAIQGITLKGVYSEEYKGTAKSNYDLAVEAVTAALEAINTAANTATTADTWDAYKTAINTINGIYTAPVNQAKATGSLMTALDAIPTMADEPTEAAKLSFAKTKVLNEVTAKIETYYNGIISTADNSILTEQLKGTAADADKIAKYKEMKEEATENLANAKDVLTYLVNAKEDYSQLIKGYGSPFNAATATVKTWDFISGSLTFLNDSNAVVTYTATQMTDIVKHVAKLKADAELIKASIEIDGSTSVAIDDLLADQIEETYKTGSTSTSVSGMTSNQEVVARINKLTGSGTFEINGRMYNGVGAWATTGFEADQTDAVRAAIKNAKDTISAALSVKEADAAYLAALEAYKKIPTTADKASAQAQKEFRDLLAEYNNGIDAYVDFKIATIKATDYDYNAGTWKVALKAKLLKAYTVDELKAAYAAAKADVDALKSKADLKAAKEAIDARIAALPKTITVADRETVLKLNADIEDHNDYCTEIGSTIKVVVTGAATNALVKVKALDNDAIKSAYDKIMLDGKVTVDEKAAVAELRKAFDEYVANYTAENAAALETPTSVTSIQITTVESDLSDAEIQAVREMIAKLPADGSNAEAVKAARTAYDALSLFQKVAVGSLTYGKLVDAEKMIKFTDADAKAYVFDQATKATSVKLGAKKVKVTANFDASKLIENGYTVEYKFYKSTKKSSGYKYTVTKSSDNATYTNTNAKKGKNYYKFKVVVKNADGTVILTTALKDCKYACRTIK